MSDKRESVNYGRRASVKVKLYISVSSINGTLCTLLPVNWNIKSMELNIRPFSFVNTL